MYSVTKDTNSADMPLDELMSSGMPPKTSNKTIPGSSALVVIPGTQSGSSILNRMSNALQFQMRPAQMTADEERLWDVVQELVQSATTANANDRDADYWQQKYEQREQEWSEQQAEHDRALRAIQRVMADVTGAKQSSEEEIERLRDELEHSQRQRDETILKLTSKLKEMQQEVNAARENRSVVARENTDEPATDDSTERVETLLSENRNQAKRIEELEQDLKKKSDSLETAKSLVTSLEQANSNLAQELRAKLKEKEDELATLTSTSADRKRTLESLAAELRELQMQQQRPRMTPQQVANQRALCQMLEKNVKALRQAAVHHEAKNDKSSVDAISQIVSETDRKSVV